MTPREFDAEFTKRKTLLSRFWVWYYGFCQTCRGQQYSSVTNTICPTCDGYGHLLDGPFKVVGWGPFSLPGERLRMHKAEVARFKEVEAMSNECSPEA